MNFSCERDTLITALSAVQKAATINTSFPILECILIECTDTLKLTGNNLEIAIEYTIPANIYKPGSICLNSKILFEIIRRMPEGVIFFEADENDNVSIRCGESNFNILGLPSEDFPDTPIVQNTSSISIEPDVLSSMLKQTFFAVAQTDIKPLLTGIKFEIEEDNIHLIALDGYKLALRNEKLENNDKKLQCIIPGKALNELVKIITDEKNQITMHISDKHVMFQFSDCIFIARLLEGEFMNYKAIIPKEHKLRVLVETDEFIKSLERAALISEASKGEKTPIKLLFQTNKITTICATERGKVEDTIESSSNDIENFEIGFNHKFLLEAVKVAGCDKIVMEFTGSVNPVVIKPEEGDSFIFIVLPVRLK